MIYYISILNFDEALCTISLRRFKRETIKRMIMIVFICDNIVPYSDDGSAAPRFIPPTSPSYRPVLLLYLVLDEFEPLVYYHRLTAPRCDILDV